MGLLRDLLPSILPPWLAARLRKGKKSGFRFIWALVAPLDSALDKATQGLAAMLGLGTPTALPLIGRSRGIPRGQADTDDEYMARCRAWLTTWEGAGSMQAVATQIHAYFRTRPAVEIVNRAGFLVRCDVDGTLSTAQITWNWDGTSNPERSGDWSDLWVIVYTTQFTRVGVFGNGDGQTFGSPGGVGSSNTPEEFDAIGNILATWKSASSRVRSLIINRTNTRPVPNGNWGLWHNPDGTPSSRDVTNNFFWEFS